MSKYLRWAAWIAYVMVGLWVFKDLLSAHLGPIDDHEYVRFANVGELTPGNFWRALIQETEVGSWAESSRFRPIYYAMRVFSAQTIGDDAGLRYLARICVVLVIGALSSLLVSEIVLLVTSWRLPSLAHPFLAIWFLGLTSWSDIVPRLGPSELTLALAYCLAWYLAARGLNKDRAVRLRELWLMLAAVALAVGVKENGFVVLVPCAVLLIFRRPVNFRRPLVWAPVCAVAAWCLFVALGLIVGIKRTGSDVYGREVIASGMLSHLGDAFRSRGVVLSVIAVVVLMAIASSQAFGRVTAILMGFVGTIVADYVFYRGQITAPLRYFVLTELSSAVVLTAAGITVGAYLVRHSGRSVERFWLVVPIFLGAIAFLQVANPLTNLQLLHAQSKQVRESTSAWDDHVSGLRAMIADGRYQQVVLYITNTGSYERAAAMIQFLSYGSDANLRFFVVADIDEAGAVDPILAEYLADISRRGHSAWSVTPLSEMDTSAPAFCLADAPTTSQDVDLCDGVGPL